MTIFSNPMVDALTSLTSKDNTKFYSSSGKHGQYVPIPGLCTNYVFADLTGQIYETINIILSILSLTGSLLPSSIIMKL